MDEGRVARGRVEDGKCEEGYGKRHGRSEGEMGRMKRAKEGRGE